jgi:hypothetical protein
MLPPFIIEQIRKREEEEKARYDQPTLDLPIPRHPVPARPRLDIPPTEDESRRGVFILEL